MMLRSRVSGITVLSALFTLLVVLTVNFTSLHRDEIAFASNRSGNWEIYRLDLRTGSTINLSRHPADDRNPACSPDGERLAFQSDRDGDRRPEIYVVNADGSQLKRVVHDSDHYASPVFAPDGRSVMVVRGLLRIEVLDIESSQRQELSLGFSPSLSANGRWLLFDADVERNADVFLMDLQDTTTEFRAKIDALGGSGTPAHTVNLTDHPADDFDPAWSPDGQRIAFLSSRGGRSALYVMDADGTNVRALTTATIDSMPAWSSDGRWIAFAARVGGKQQLYLIKADGTDLHAITASTGDSNAPS